VSFEIYSRVFLKNVVASPISKNAVPSLSEATSVLGVFNIFSNNLRDFTKASVWFPNRPQGQLTSTKAVSEYNLSIPRLNIKDARVVVGGEDLTGSLVHYLPESMPGEYGNVAIFGHSTLPQLYNQKDYKTIFTYLPSLEKGDTVEVKVGDIKYEYEVTNSFVVDPSEVSVLEQTKDGSYLTLVTCVPPGTYWKRLVVKARLKLI
jgi:sortase A